MNIKSIGSNACKLALTVGFVFALSSGQGMAASTNVTTQVTTQQGATLKSPVQLAYYYHGNHRNYYRGNYYRGYYGGHGYYRGYGHCKRVCYVNRFGGVVNCRRHCW